MGCLMEFLIGRTSGRIKEEKEKPHIKAHIKEVTATDSRSISKKALMADKYKWKQWGEKWYEKGENHREESGHIKKNFKEDIWAIDIEVEDILKFMIDVGSPICLSYSRYPEIAYAIWIEDAIGCDDDG